VWEFVNRRPSLILKGGDSISVLDDLISFIAHGPSFIVYSMTREEELKKEGWEKKFTVDEPRLSEMAEQYEEVGFEVLLEPVDTSSEECTRCLSASHDRYKTIYTRPKR
jgi:hypothetical protein